MLLLTTLGAAALGALVALVARYERRVLAALDASPDPEIDAGLTFPADVVHRVETSDGGRIHVEECGNGRPVVLLHGHGSNLSIFAPLAARLRAAGTRVVALDHRGFGRSSVMGTTFGLDGLVDDLAAVLRALDLREAIVLGHSMGGGIALELAARRPEVVDERVAGLVLVNSAARGPGDGLLMRARASMLDWQLVERLGRHPHHGVVLTRANFGPSARRSHVVGVRAVGFASPAARRPGFTRRSLGIDLTDRLSDIRVPVLVLAGGADRVLPVAASQRLADSIAGARLIVFGDAGHVLPVERADEVAASVLGFIEELRPARPTVADSR